MGWVLDVYVEYLIRVVARLIMRIRSASWRTVNGTVIYSECRGAIGCPVARVSYKYEVKGQEYEGVTAKPFIFHSSGELYAEHFPEGQQLVVRVSPQNAARSIVLENEQSNPWLIT
jgi:uncharacterized protein DUF3592